MKILETSRLELHEFQLFDAPFLLDIMNQAGYHRYIGDRGLRSIEDASVYIEDKFRSGYYVVISYRFAPCGGQMCVNGFREFISS